MEQQLSTFAILSYGAAGAMMSLLVLQVLPFATSLTRGMVPEVTGWHILGAVIVVLISIAGGAVTAIVIGDVSHAKQAIVYGVGWEGTFTGLIQGTISSRSRLEGVQTTDGP